MAINTLKNGTQVPTIGHTPWQTAYEENWALTDKYIPHQTATLPSVTDDIDNGFDIGSRWVDTSTLFIYRCEDATAGAAVWVRDISATDANINAVVSSNPDVVANTAHSAGDGSDHSFINQDVTKTSSPIFAGLAIVAGGSVIVEFDFLNCQFYVDLRANYFFCTSFQLGPNLITEIEQNSVSGDEFKLSSSKAIAAYIASIIDPTIEYADNAAAKGGGLQDGDLYRTGDVLKIVHS